MAHLHFQDTGSSVLLKTLRSWCLISSWHDDAVSIETAALQREAIMMQEKQGYFFSTGAELDTGMPDQDALSGMPSLVSRQKTEPRVGVAGLGLGCGE